MQKDTIYEEKIFSKATVLLSIIVTAVLLFALLYQILIGPMGDRPAPNWLLLCLFLVFLAITLNFSRLGIRMTPEFIVVSYGIFKHKIRWEDIEDCYLDAASTMRYGGWGIRIGKVKGKTRLVYNVAGAPRVVLSLKKGKFGEFVFSTNKPEEVINLVKQQIGRIR